MSRLSRKPLILPASVKATFDGKVLNLTSKNGSKNVDICYDILDLKIEGQTVIVAYKEITDTNVKRKLQSRFGKSILGTTIANIKKFATNLDKFFVKNINLVGVGFKATLLKTYLILDMGYSHPIYIEIPSNVVVTVEKMTAISISSADQDAVAKVVALIVQTRPVEPYKGKGAIVQGQFVLRKESKKKSK